MSWKRIDIDDVRLSLAEDEIERLNTLSLDESKLNMVIQETADMVADMFRASWQGKGYEIDPREHFVSGGYMAPILAVIRYELWTRFPQSELYALSEPRKLQYEKAMELLKNPWLGTDKVNWADPDLSAYTALSGGTGSSIAVPFMRLGYDICWFNGMLRQ